MLSYKKPYCTVPLLVTHFSKNMRSCLSVGINHSSSASCKSNPGCEYLNFWCYKCCLVKKMWRILDKIFSIVNKSDYMIWKTLFKKSFGELEHEIYFLPLTFWNLDICFSLYLFTKYLIFRHTLAGQKFTV